MPEKFHSLIFSINYNNNSRHGGAHRIAHVLRAEDWDCEVVDFVLYWDYEKLKELVKARVTSKTVFFGFSVFANSWTGEMDNFVEWLKQTYPGVSTVIGGQEILKTQLKKENIDWYIDSFADYAILELTKYLASNGPRPVADLNEQMSSGRKVIKANTSYPAYPMKSLSQDYEERDFIAEREILTVEIGRGCIFKCDFCNFPILGVKGDYTRDSLDFEQDLKRNYDKWGVKEYFLADETFNDYTNKIIKFADVVDKLPFQPWFGGFLRADLVVSRPQDWEHIARMRLFGHHYGFESLNHPSAKSIGKGMDSAKLANGILKAREYFKTVGPYRGTITFIAGLQYETPETLKKTEQWLLNNWTDENFIYFPLTISHREGENPSKLSTEWQSRGYTVTDRHIDFDFEKLNRSYHVGMPRLLWKNEHMDIYDAMNYVSDLYENHYSKFKESFWSFPALRRDWNLSMDEILKLPGGAHNNYTPQAEANRTKFFEDYMNKKLNFRP